MADTDIFISDFCILPTGEDPHTLSQFERLTLVGGHELERALDWIGKQVNRFSSEGRLGDLSPEKVEQAIQFYSSPELVASPASFFTTPVGTPKVEEFQIHGLKDGEILDLKFKSGYQVQNPAFKAEYDLCLENQTVYARMWRHRTPARATVIAIHGWIMGDQKVNALALQPGFFYALGLDVVLVELPYHGRRAPAKKGNAPMFPDSNMSRTNEGMAQIISDLRELKSYLESCGAQNIGCIGMSLGGYTASLWASLDQLSFCVPMVPMASMADIAWDMLMRDDALKEKLSSIVSLEALTRIYRLHSPLTYKPKLSAARRMIVAGLGDEIISPRHPHMLWEHWDRPQIHWFSGGHAAQFKDAKVFHEIGHFLKSLGLTSVSPSTLSSQ